MTATKYTKKLNKPIAYLTRLGEEKCVYIEKTIIKRVTRLGGPLFLPSQVLYGNVGKVGSPRVARVEG